MPPSTGSPLEERIAVLESALADYRKHHQEVHKLSDDLVVANAADIERRLEQMNKFREQILQERGLFLLRETYEERQNALINRVAALELQYSNLQGRFWMMGAVISAIVSLVVVTVELLVKFWR